MFALLILGISTTNLKKLSFLDDKYVFLPRVNSQDKEVTLHRKQKNMFYFAI
jgi:hypothetical protein